MKKIELTKSVDGFRLMDQWHDRFESRLTIQTVTKRLETSFGFSDALIGCTDDQTLNSGSPKLPVVLLHGALSGAPHSLGELRDLPHRQLIHAINIPGQSTRAEQVRLDFRSDEYSRWLCEILDQLYIDRAILCGVSWGGSVALQLAKSNPDRIGGLLLVVPGSIVKGPVAKGVRHIAIPMLRYKLFPTEKNRDRAFSQLLTTPDDFWSDYMADAFRHWKIDFKAPPLITKQDLDSFNAPVYVIAAEKDLSFPGDILIERSKSLFKNFMGSHLIKGSRHCPPTDPDSQIRFTQIVEDVLGQLNAQANNA